jgi:hypothetical protein
VASGPYGDAIIYAFWDGSKSELHSVSVTTGDDELMVERDEIIHAVILDSRSGDVFFTELDSESRHHLGIFRQAAGGDPERVIPPTPDDDPTGADQISERLWITPDGSRLVVMNCPSACEVSVFDAMNGQGVTRFSMTEAQDTVGITDDSLIAIYGCDAPCPATAYDLATGDPRAFGVFCDSAQLTLRNGRPTLVSDWPVGDDCFSASYSIGGSDIASGETDQIQTWPQRNREIIPFDASQGAAPPGGWVILGPQAGLIGFGGQRNIGPWLVRATDALVVPLPTLGQPRIP